jgi:hypothetical protein
MPGPAGPGPTDAARGKVTAVEVGLRIRYGKLVPGREIAAIELFRETATFLQDRIQAGDITYFEPFMMQTSDLDEELGFWIIKGPMPSMFQLIDSDEYKGLLMKAVTLVEHVHVDWLTVGEGIAEQVERSLKIHAELKI